MTEIINRNGDLCPACGEGHLSLQRETRLLEYKGTQGNVFAYYSVCDYCESELTGKTESVENVRAISAFHKKVDNLMSGDQIKQFRKNLGISQAIAAELFGGGQVAFSRYENDDITQSLPMDNLLKLCSQNPYNILLLAQERQIQLDKVIVHRINREYFNPCYDLTANVLDWLDDDLSKILPISIDDYKCANDDQIDFVVGSTDIPELLNWAHA